MAHPWDYRLDAIDPRILNPPERQDLEAPNRQLASLRMWQNAMRPPLATGSRRQRRALPKGLCPHDWTRLLRSRHEAARRCDSR